MRDTVAKSLAQAILNCTGKPAEGNTIAEVLESYNKQFINASVQKLTPADIAWAPGDTTSAAKANQHAVNVKQKGRVVTVTGKLADLQSYASSDATQGTAKWVGLVVDTEEPDITALTYNGSALTASDVAEAASVGQGAGKFVLWIKAEVVSAAAKTIVLASSTKPSATYTINFVNE